MALERAKNYLVLNYNPSAVAVRTRFESYLIPGGTQAEPASMPFNLDEIAAINSGSNAFKIGLLWFEPEYEEEIYNELRITNWRNILTDDDIKDILLNPTMEGLQKVIDIDVDAYFERVRGIFVHLRNTGADISTKVETVINGRYKELVNRKRESAIRLAPVAPKENPSEMRKQVEEMKAQLSEMEELKRQLAAMQEMMAGMTPKTQEASKAADKAAGEPVKQAKPAAKQAKKTK